MIRFVLILLLWLLLPSWAQSFETKVFVLNARSAESTVEMIRPLLSPGGKVIPETRLNKLVVRDTPEVLQEVEALLNEIDQHLPQVRLHVTLNGVASGRSTQASVGVAGTNRRVYATGSAVSSQINSQVNAQQNLVVMSGERGLIHVQRNILNGNPYQQFAVQMGLLPPAFLFQSVESGFAVEPVVVGDVVRLRITPWLSFASPQGNRTIQVEQASTSVAVRSGDTVQIGSGGYNQETQNRAFGLIFGGGSSSVSTSQSMTLRPVIMDY